MNTSKSILLTAALLTSAATVHATTIFGVNTQNQLVRFDSATPGTLTTVGTISQPGIVDIDFYPVNGQLYGITANGSAYIINQSSAVASLIITPLTALTAITDFDFNPQADRIRIFGDVDQNFRMVPDVTSLPSAPGVAGTVIADGTFTNTAFQLVANAYTNNFDSVASTTLYSIDTATDSLVIHSVAPQFNTVGAVGLLGVAVGTNVGFDVAQDGVAYLNDGTNFFTVNLASGAASPAGVIGGLNAIPVTTIAAVAVIPEPGTALFGAGLALVGLMSRKRKA